MDAGVKEGRVNAFMSHQLLNRRDMTTCVEELGGEGVAKLVRGDGDTCTCAECLDAVTDDVFAERFAAVDEQVVRLCVAA